MSLQHVWLTESSTWLGTFEGDIGPAYARTVTGTSLGLFCCFQLWLSGLPCTVGSWILLSSETSGNQGPPIQGGVELSKDPMSGTKKLSMESPIKKILGMKPLMCHFIAHYHNVIFFWNHEQGGWSESGMDYYLKKFCLLLE